MEQQTRKTVNQEKHFECQNKLKTIQSYNLLMKRNLSRMASTTLVKTMFSQNKPPTTTLPGCGDVGDTTLKRSIDLTVGVLIATLNIIEIIIIAKIKREKKNEIILLSLSVSDCMFALSNVFVSMPYIVSICRFQDVIETAYTLYVFFVLTSIFHLLFITVDRLIAVLQPLKHKTSLSRRFYIYLAILWILALTISVLLQIIDSFTNAFEKKVLIPMVPKQTCHDSKSRGKDL